MNATYRPAQAAGKSPLRMWTILALIAAAGFVYLAIVPRQTQQGTEGTAIGRTLPYFHLDPLTGDSKTISADDLKERVTVVNYWGTWCPPCRLEFPHMVELASKLADRESFQLLAVSCGQEGDKDLTELRSQTMEFLAARGVSIATYADQNGASRQAMAIALGLEGFGYPTTIVFDQSAIIRGFWVGYKPGVEREMESLVRELLEKSGG